MKTRKEKPALSLKNALIKSSSSRSMETKDHLATDMDKYLVEIIPGLFIANYETVKDYKLLKQRKIDVVINLISHKCDNMYPDIFFYENYELDDSLDENLTKIVIMSFYKLKNISKRIVESLFTVLKAFQGHQQLQWHIL